MSKSGFGERLRRDRELRGVSREEISAATRIASRFLEALENEQWERLPGGVFNRGFLRAVARFLGLDEDDLIAQYDLAVAEQYPQIEASANPPVPQEKAKIHSRRFVLVGLVGTLCGLVFLGAGWFGWGWAYRSPQQAASRSDTAPSAVPAPGQPEGNPVSASNENTGNSRSAVLASTLAPTGAAARALELKVEAGKETAVSVSADGSKVFEGNMIAGQSRTFTAQDAIDISAEDAGALLLELNGQTLAPLGPPGQGGNATLTRGDVKATGGGAD
jgi:cytoskeleton protein RodZ